MLTDEQTADLIRRFTEGQRPISIARELRLDGASVIAAWRAWNREQLAEAQAQAEANAKA